MPKEEDIESTISIRAANNIFMINESAISRKPPDVHLPMKKGRQTVLNLDDEREKMWVSVLERKMGQLRGWGLA